MVKILKKDEEVIEIFSGSSSNTDILNWVNHKLTDYKNARETFWFSHPIRL